MKIYESFLNSIELEIPYDRGHLLVDFPIRQIEPCFRQTALAKYGPISAIEGKENYVIVAEILNGDHDFLLVPPQFAECTFAQGSLPVKRPHEGYENSSEFNKILMESTHEDE